MKTRNRMNPRKKKTTIGVALALAIALAAGVATVLAVDDLGVFELDGNAVDNTAGAPDDWQTVNVPPPGGSPGNSIARTGVLVDPAGTTIFRGGGSKDINDVNQWRHVSGSVPPKDEITNAYAAAYIVPGPPPIGAIAGDLVVVAGLDRFANNGDANAGFWFLQQEVGPQPDGTFGPGVHSVGDTLVVVEFTGGGEVGTVRVFRWNGTTIELEAETAGCSDPHDLNDPCGQSNTGPIQLFWNYTPSVPEGTNVAPTGSFVEVGVNLSQLARDNGTATPCITSVIVETRSSSEPNAVLKDFVAGDLNVCEVELSKDCLGGTFDAQLGKFVVDYQVTVRNTGGTTVNQVIATDNSCTPGDSSDDTTLTFGPLAGGALQTLPGQCILDVDQIPDPPDPLRNGVSAVADPASIPVVLADTCFTDPASPGVCFDDCPLETNPQIDGAKNCVTRLVDAGDVITVRVLFNGNVTNTSDQTPAPVPLENVQVLDHVPSPGQFLELFDGSGNSLGTSTTLNPGEQAFFEGSYDPASVNSECPEEASFTNMVTVSGNDVVFGTFVDEDRSATCELCPGTPGCENLPPDPIP